MRTHKIVVVISEKKSLSNGTSESDFYLLKSNTMATTKATLVISNIKLANKDKKNKMKNSLCIIIPTTSYSFVK